MRRDKQSVYEVYDGDKLVFEGTIDEIADKFGAKYNAIWQSINRKTRYRWKYSIYFKYKHRRLYKITNPDGESFTGTTEEIAKKLCETEGAIINAFFKNYKLLNEWEIKEVTNEQN